MRTSTLISLGFFATQTLGCGLLDDTLPGRDARCDMRPAYDQCTDLRDFKGPSFFTFEGVCGTLRAAVGSADYQEDARCDMAGVIGGCRAHNGDGSDQTNWFYSGEKYKTEADVKEECGNGQDFQAPEP
ncbi:hypothetical protein [Hyalangium gracile]|uniref:hypothetical protein n=1 Tax=Hyalangium gracile TaxID=394092 RepID=UPI001CCBB765|nr:hypothetical protein [Hyalangium gracile]